MTPRPGVAMHRPYLNACKRRSPFQALLRFPNDAGVQRLTRKMLPQVPTAEVRCSPRDGRTHRSYALRSMCADIPVYRCRSRSAASRKRGGSRGGRTQRGRTDCRNCRPARPRAGNRKGSQEAASDRVLWMRVLDVNSKVLAQGGSPKEPDGLHRVVGTSRETRDPWYVNRYSPWQSACRHAPSADTSTIASAMAMPAHRIGTTDVSTQARKTSGRHDSHGGPLDPAQRT